MSNLNTFLMKKWLIMIIAVLSFLSFSCKKDSEEQIPAVKADYYQLKVGNYWIYQRFNVDTNGVATPMAKYDSAFIEKDTLIHGFTYLKLKENPYVLFPEQISSYLRDSSGYLVNSAGYILASDVNFTTVLAVDTTHPDLYVGYLQMTGKDSLVTTEAGNFQSITPRRKIIPTPPNIANLPIRYTYEIYGKGVGKMKTHSFFFSGGMTFETRLVRYKLN